MNLSELKPAIGSRHRCKRVGRGVGSGHGKTSTRGHKGGKARSGWRRRPGFEGGQMPLIRRTPKRGFRNVFKVKWNIINLEQLDRFKSGEINPQFLLQQGLIKNTKYPLKVLGTGTLKHPLVIKANHFSSQAIEKVKTAGGKTEIIK